MNPFPFIGGSYAARSPAFDNQRTVNLYPETSGSGTSKSVAMLVGCPGLVLWATLPTYPIRGSLRVSATLALIAAGGALYQVTTQGVATLVGPITPGTTPISMASDGTYVMLVTGETGFFVTLATMVLTPITDQAFAGADVVDFLDGFFVFNTPGTKQFQITGLYAETFDALDFASAEALPDTLLTLIVDHDELWLFSSAHTEVWSNVGAALFPFQRIQGAVIEQGCAAPRSVAKLDNTVVWLTADDRGHGTVQKAVGYTPQRISDHALEFAIASYSRIDDAVAYTYQQEGHLFYVLTFPTAQKTWAYDTATEKWHERAWRDPVTGQLTQHRSICHMAFAGLNIVGDYQNGNLYSLDLDCYTDNGNVLPAIRQCPHIAQGNAWQFFSKLWIDMQMGVGTNVTPPVPLLTVTGAAVTGYSGYATANAIALISNGTGLPAFGSISAGAMLAGYPVQGFVYAPSFGFSVVLLGQVAQAIFSVSFDFGGAQTLRSTEPGVSVLVREVAGVWLTEFIIYRSLGNISLIEPTPIFDASVAALDPTNPHLMLEWSDDGGQSFGSELTVPMGKLGERTARANFRRLGKSRDRVWRATITDPVKRIFIGAGVEFTVGS